MIECQVNGFIKLSHEDTTLVLKPSITVETLRFELPECEKNIEEQTPAKNVDEQTQTENFNDEIAIESNENIKDKSVEEIKIEAKSDLRCTNDNHSVLMDAHYNEEDDFESNFEYLTLG